MNKNCKWCGKELEFSIGGVLRDFCNDEHRNLYRLEYKRRKEQKRREASVDNSGNGNDRIPPKMDNRNPLISSTSGGSKTGSRIFKKVKMSLKEKYAAKNCSNYPIAQREGFCLTMSAPYRGFKFDCDNCPIASMLVNLS